jgi:hypothetical protein
METKINPPAVQGFYCPRLEAHYVGRTTYSVWDKIRLFFGVDKRKHKWKVIYSVEAIQHYHHYGTGILNTGKDYGKSSESFLLTVEENGLGERRGWKISESQKIPMQPEYILSVIKNRQGQG